MATVNLLFSVIIPTRDRPDSLAECLSKLAPAKQGISGDQYEIIVSDDGDFPCQELIEKDFPYVRWVAGPKQGPAANRNHGAKFASGKWLAFADDDCLPQAGWLQAYADCLSEDFVALSGPIEAYALVRNPNARLKKQMQFLPKSLRTFLADGLFFPYSECPTTDGSGFYSANIVVRKDVFDRLGGFDTKYLMAAHEDDDLRRRLKQTGTMVVVPQARVLHQERIVPLGKAFRQAIPLCKNWTRHTYKHAAEVNFKNTGDYVQAWCRHYARFLLPTIKSKRLPPLLMLIWRILIGPFVIPLTLAHEKRKSG